MFRIAKRMITWSLVFCLLSGALGIAWAEGGDALAGDWLQRRQHAGTDLALNRISLLSASGYICAALKQDGTVLCVGSEYFLDDEKTVSTWTDIVSISADSNVILGLKSDGNVNILNCGGLSYRGYGDVKVVETSGYYGLLVKNDGTVEFVDAYSSLEENQIIKAGVAKWQDIIDVSGDLTHAVGLKSDGTVVAVGTNEYGECDVDDWTGIVDVEAGWGVTLGLKADGTVLVTGDISHHNEFYDDTEWKSKVEGWTDIVQVSVGWGPIAGLKHDGTVVIAGYSPDEAFYDTESWTDIININMGDNLIALKADGTVCLAGSSTFEGIDGIGTWTGIGPYNPNPSTPDSQARQAIGSIAAGDFYSVVLKSDGTVVAVGLNNWRQCKVGSWKDIVAVASGGFHTVGLKSDGTVVATGLNDWGTCDVGGWRDIVAVAAGNGHTVGLKADGTVVAAGANASGQCDVIGWRGIVAVAAGDFHTLGLKSDGTVVATGLNTSGQCDVIGWRDIVAIAAGDGYTVGLKSDGTVIATGTNGSGQCNVSAWKNIVAIAAGKAHTVGLRSDGIAVATGSNRYRQCNVGVWRDIVAVSAGDSHTLGLQSDGTVVGTGSNAWNECDFGGRWLTGAVTPRQPSQSDATADVWPKQADATILVIWTDSAGVNGELTDAVERAYSTVGYTGWIGSVTASEADSARYLKAYINQVKSGQVAIDAIYLFPYAGVDYSEALKTAAESGIAVHVFESEDPADVFDEICGLYGYAADNAYSAADNAYSAAAWPKQSDATILLLWTESARANGKLTDAVERANSTVGYTGRIGSVMASEADSARYLKAYINQVKSGQVAIDAIYLFPYAGVDYSEALNTAAESGIAVHVFESEKPADVFDEICGLYDCAADNEYSAAAWPKQKDATILLLCTESAGEVIDAVEQANNAVKHTGKFGSLTASKADSVRYLMVYINQAKSSQVAIDAIYLFPYTGVDYSEALKLAAESGIAVHVFESEDPADVFDEICKLYDMNAQNPYR